MAKLTKTTALPQDTLPGSILKTDLEYPSWESKQKLRKPAREKLDVIETYTLHYTARFGWVLATLHISRGKRGQPDRSYGITVANKPGRFSGNEKQLVTVGNGPHVLRTITVYVTRGRQKDLQWLIDLYQDGMARAGDTRDRISTRRANTISRRRAFGSWF